MGILEKDPTTMDIEELIEALESVSCIVEKLETFFTRVNARNDMQGDTYYKRVPQGLEMAESGACTMRIGIRTTLDNL